MYKICLEKCMCNTFTLTMKTIRLNTRSKWTPPYVEHFMTNDDFGHINTPSQNEPHNFEHWTQIPERSTEIVLVTLNTCVSHFVSTTVISQFILILSYNSCNAFKCCSKRRKTRTMSGKRKYTEKTLVKKAKALQDLDNGMSMRTCTTKYSISVGTIINWKKNKSEIISSIFEFTSFSKKTSTSQQQRQGHRWKSLQMVCQRSLSKHSRFWPNFANQSSTSGGQHWFEQF